jgi:hypothetical protein
MQELAVNPVYSNWTSEDQRGGVNCPESHSWSGAHLCDSFKLSSRQGKGHNLFQVTGLPLCLAFPFCLEGEENIKGFLTNMLILGSFTSKPLAGDPVKFTKPPGHVTALVQP